MLGGTHRSLPISASPTFLRYKIGGGPERRSQPPAPGGFATDPDSPCCFATGTEADATSAVSTHSLAFHDSDSRPYCVRSPNTRTDSLGQPRV